MNDNPIVELVLRVKDMNDNPIVELVLRFKDGAALRQVFTTPVPQGKGMAALGKMVADLGAELNIQLPEEKAAADSQQGAPEASV